MSEHPRRLGHNNSNPFHIAAAAFAGLFLLLLLSPVLQDALMYPGKQESRRIVSCQSNMKQLNLALTQYEQDNDGKPPAYERSTSGPSWREAVYPFVKSIGVYECASDKRTFTGATSSHLPSSYGVNLLRGKDDLLTPLIAPIPGWPLVSDPSQTIRIVDMRGYNGSEWNMTSPAFLPNTGRELFTHVRRYVFYERPVGNFNCLFVDGHVKRLKPMATLKPVNLWTRDNAPFTGQDLQNARAILTHAEDE